jgi:hypothetical protein
VLPEALPAHTRRLLLAAAHGFLVQVTEQVEPPPLLNATVDLSADRVAGKPAADARKYRSRT